MDQNLALMLTAGVAFVAAVVAVLAVAALLEARFGSRAKGLERQLERAREMPAEDALTERIARGIEVRLPALIERLRDNAWLSAIELLLLRAGGRLGLTGLFWLMAGLALAAFVAVMLMRLGWLAAAGSALLAALLPLFVLQLMAARRRARFEAQFPEALDFIARALRAGHGLMAGLGMVAEELSQPVAGEFGKVFEEVNFGVPVGEAMARMVARVDSRDLEFFVVAVSIQRETGGNLAELLGSLAATVRERMKLGGKVRALSSEGRLSGVLMVALPFVLAAILSAINPDYMSLLWTTPEGRNVVAITLVMMLLGTVWIMALVRIRV